MNQAMTMNRNQGRMGNMAQTKRQQLYSYINRVSFAVNDITLYLDTHPKDEAALSYFIQYEDLRRTALKTYAEHFGPLTLDTTNPDCNWSWGEQPLPWEGGCM